MNFINRDRRIGRLPLSRALASIPGHASEWSIGLRHDGGSIRRRFGLPGQRIGFPGKVHPVWTNDVVLITRARCDPRQKQLPNSGAMADPHRMPATVPRIEIADDSDPSRIRRPYGKPDALTPPIVSGCAPRALSQFEMTAFVEQMKIDVAEEKPK